MATPRHHLRSTLIAAAAIWGVSLVSPGMAAADSPGRDRALAMLRSGCCCVTRPTSGCCCETKTPLTLNPDQASFPAGASAVETAERVADSASGTCGCASSAPAAPGPSPDRQTAGGGLDPGHGVDRVWHGHVACPSPAMAAALRPGGLSKCPLYLRTARLLI